MICDVKLFLRVSQICRTWKALAI